MPKKMVGGGGGGGLGFYISSSRFRLGSYIIYFILYDLQNQTKKYFCFTNIQGSFRSLSVTICLIIRYIDYYFLPVHVLVWIIDDCIMFHIMGGRPMIYFTLILKKTSAASYYKKM